MDPENHTGTILWSWTEDVHTGTYDCCHATVVSAETHQWKDRVCITCGYEKAAEETPPQTEEGNQQESKPETANPKAENIGPTKKQAVKLKAPGKVKVSPSYDRIKLSWSKSKNAKGYEVYRATRKKGSYKRVKTTKASSWTDKKVTAGKTYYYKVRAYSESRGKKQYSAYTKVQKTIARPSAPSLKLKASKSGIRAKWSKVRGATKYPLYRANAKNKKYRRCKEGRKTNYTDRKVRKGKTYY